MSKSFSISCDLEAAMGVMGERGWRLVGEENVSLRLVSGGLACARFGELGPASALPGAEGGGTLAVATLGPESTPRVSAANQFVLDQTFEPYSVLPPIRAKSWGEITEENGKQT